MKTGKNIVNRLVLTMAATGTLGFAAAQAQELASANVLQGSGTISVSKPHRYADVVVEGDAVAASYTFTTQAGDVGKTANIYVVARIADGDATQSYALAATGKWQPWDGNPQSLPAYRTKVLQASETLPVLNGKQLFAGDYTVNVGYQVSGGALVYSQEPLQFSVAAVESDSLQRFVSAEAMEAYIKESLLNGTNYGGYPELLRFATATAAPSLDSAGSRTSTTNLQEGGVDEADTIKVNGDTLFMLASCETSSCLQVQRLDSTAPKATLLSTVKFDNEQSPQGMYFIDDSVVGQDTLVTLGSHGGGYWLWRSAWTGWQDTKTEINFLDVSNPSSVSNIETLTFDGALVSSRVVDDTLYLVTRYTPYIDGLLPYPVAEADEKRNEELIAATTLPAILPHVVDSRDEVTALVQSKDCYLPVSAVDGSRNPSIVTITGISLKDPKNFRSTCFLGSSETLYMTTDALYLATTSWDYDVRALDNLIYSPEHTTAVHKFALTGGGIDYRGSGTVKGHLGWHEDKKSFRMGANGKYLNIATSIGDTWNGSSTTRLSVLKEAGGKRLETVSVIDGIGKPNEQLYAARFLGDRAYLVTFRLMDPLYVVDLSAQENPKLLGELEIEGYSEYLHPISDTLLLGLGKDAIAVEGQSDILDGRGGALYQGLKIALFDVSNPAKPREIDSKIIGKRGTESDALYDHHAFTYLPPQGDEPARFAIPVQLNDRPSTWWQGDPNSPQVWYDYTHTGLYSFEVSEDGISQVGRIIAETSDERAQREGSVSSAAVGTGSRIAVDLIAPIFTWYGDRSVLKDDAVFYIHNGKVLTSFWGESKAP